MPCSSLAEETRYTILGRSLTVLPEEILLSRLFRLLVLLILSCSRLRIQKVEICLVTGLPGCIRHTCASCK